MEESVVIKEETGDFDPNQTKSEQYASKKHIGKSVSPRDKNYSQIGEGKSSARKIDIMDGMTDNRSNLVTKGEPIDETPQFRTSSDLLIMKPKKAKIRDID